MKRLALGVLFAATACGPRSASSPIDASSPPVPAVDAAAVRDAGVRIEDDLGVPSDGGSVEVDADSPADGDSRWDASIASTGPGLVWVAAEASGFNPLACGDNANPFSTMDDFDEMTDYVSAQVAKAGLTEAGYQAAGSYCDGPALPPFIIDDDVFTGTPSAMQAFIAAPPAPFVGKYVTVPVVVKKIVDIHFAYYGSTEDDGTGRIFENIWDHDGLDFTAERNFISGACTNGSSFNAAIATSPIGAMVVQWLSAQNPLVGWYIGYDATFYFADGTSRFLPNAFVASDNGVACENWVSSSP